MLIPTVQSCSEVPVAILESGAGSARLLVKYPTNFIVAAPLHAGSLRPPPNPVLSMNYKPEQNEALAYVYFTLSHK